MAWKWFWSASNVIRSNWTLNALNIVAVFKLTCNRHPRISRNVRNWLPAGCHRLGAGIQRIRDSAGGMLVELCGDGHWRRSGADGIRSRNSHAVLMMMAKCIVDHGVRRCYVTSETSRVSAWFIVGGVNCGGGCQCCGTRAWWKARYHCTGGGSIESGNGLLLMMVGGGGRHVRIHSGRWRRRRCAAIAVLRRRSTRRSRRAIIHRRAEAGLEVWCGGWVREQLLMMELLMVLREHAIDDEFGTHCWFRSLHRTLPPLIIYAKSGPLHWRTTVFEQTTLGCTLADYDAPAGGKTLRKRRNLIVNDARGALCGLADDDDDGDGQNDERFDVRYGRALNRLFYWTSFNPMPREILTRPSPLLLRILYDPCMFGL